MIRVLGPNQQVDGQATYNIVIHIVHILLHGIGFRKVPPLVGIALVEIDFHMIHVFLLNKIIGHGHK